MIKRLALLFAFTGLAVAGPISNSPDRIQGGGASVQANGSGIQMNSASQPIVLGYGNATEVNGRLIYDTQSTPTVTGANQFGFYYNGSGDTSGLKYSVNGANWATWFDYNNLVNKPTIPSLSSTNTWTATQTLTSPKILTSILDTNGNTLLGVAPTTSAVNYLTVTNSATSTLGGTISAAGTGTNLDITLTPKGTGGVNISTGQFSLNGSNNWTQGGIIRASNAILSPNFFSDTRVNIGLNGQVAWKTNATAELGSVDTALNRNAAGVVEVNNGTAFASGGTLGTLAASTLKSLAPVAAASTAAGNSVSVSASDATAGTTNAGAAAGGSVTITAGNAAQLTSGNANGGAINLTPGNGIGTGVRGQINLGVGADTQINFGAQNAYLRQQSTITYLGGEGTDVLTYTKNNGLGLVRANNVFSATSTGGLLLNNDTMLYRNAAGAFEIDGFTAGKYGQLVAGSIALQSLSSPTTAITISNQGTAGSTSYTYKYTFEQADGTSTDSGSSTATTATGNATLNGTNFNRLTLPALPTNATRIGVYRTASSGTPSSTGKIGTSTTTTFDDTGLTASGSAPTVNATGGFIGAIKIAAGNSSTASLQMPSGANYGIYDSGGSIDFTAAGTRTLAIQPSLVFMPSATVLSWNSDTIILRDAADTFAQRRGANAQAFNLYNTYTDASNYERNVRRFSGNVFEDFVEATGSGTQRQTKRYYDKAGNVFDSAGTGSPEGAVTAGIGSTWRRTDGGTSTTFYVKESGTGNTGWIAK